MCSLVKRTRGALQSSGIDVRELDQRSLLYERAIGVVENSLPWPLRLVGGRRLASHILRRLRQNTATGQKNAP